MTRTINNVIDLMNEIQNAIENRECFLIGGDYNMVAVWDEQLDTLCKFAKEQGYVD